MKKALLAASIAMMCAGASAQSYVQIYGRMNLSIEHQKDGPTDSNQVQNNSSRWGLIGNEDLGGGMKAFFNLEQGFDASNGSSTVAGTTFSRESFVGLGSKYGEIRMGAFTSPLYLATADYVSMHNHDTGTSSDAFFDNDGGLGVGGGAAGGYPTKNAISLKSPSFSGLTFEYVHGYAEDVANRGGLDTISFNYDGGALQIGGGYGHQDTLGNFGHSEILALRALYDFGNFVLGGYIEQDRFGDADRTNIRLSGMVPVGNHEFHLNYGQASDVQGHTNSGARQGTVGYNYNFSKRTKVYAFFTLVQNDDNAAYYVSTPGKTFRSLALGLRHNF